MSYSFFPHQGDESYTSAFTVVTVVREAKAPPEVIKPFTDRCYVQAQAEVTARDTLIACQATWRADHEEVEEQDKALGQTVEAERILEDTFFYEGNTHLPMEQHATVALPEDDGRVTVWSSTQTPHYLHRALTKVLGLPASRIRVVATPNGGGFGGKSDPFPHEIIISHIARRTGRPVRVRLSREEVFLTNHGRHPSRMTIQLGANNDGVLKALDANITIDGGAYGSFGVVTSYYNGVLLQAGGAHLCDTLGEGG